MLLDASQSQLVLVDYQARLMPAIFEADAVARNAVRLGKMAQLAGVPVLGTQQNPARLGENLPDIRALCLRTFDKMYFSAAQEGFGQWLRAPAPAPRGNARSLPRHLQQPPADEGRNTIVIAGCEAHVCLLQTALDLLEEQFEVWVVTDACGSRTERNRDAAFDRLAGAGAELLTTEMAGFEWLRTAEHPRFKDLQALIR
jgi:nicotinamidase-related amidase